MIGSSIVVISDHCTAVPPEPINTDCKERAAPPDAAPVNRDAITVVGGYLERLPLAWISAGYADRAEIWSFAGKDDDVRVIHGNPPGLIRRVFRAEPHNAPYASRAMIAHINRGGPPDILCVWGLGVDAEILSACARSIKIYNSIDAPALRIPAHLISHFDIFLTGSEWQSDEIRAVRPDAVIDVMPIGPEFASGDTFRPLGLPKDYDVIYVAAAQPYKRHDVLFAALAKLPRSIRCLCVVGYGELADDLRAEAAGQGLNVDFIGPPGVTHDEVNVLMNRARIGVVCGVDDGAPAILTEYMLAGLPVVANAGLRCGLQYITPKTGRIAIEDAFHEVIMEVVRTADTYTPRSVVLADWAWPHSVARLATLVREARTRRARLQTNG